MRKFNLRLPRISLDGEICSEFMARLIGLPDTNVSPQGLFTHLTSLPNK
jgi:hypothetical protein